MPIAIKDFEWVENIDHVFLTVPLKGVPCSKVDILSAENYIKVSFLPYIFECFLYAPTCDDLNTAQLSGSVVTFKLAKKEPRLWNQLQIDDLEDKQITQDIRKTALEDYEKTLAKAQTEKCDRKRNDEKFSLNQMMKIENEEKEQIAMAKQAERDKATEDLEIWKKEQIKLANEEKQKILSRAKEKKSMCKEKEKTITKEQDKLIYSDPSEITTRSPGTIEVNFTPRVFPTPVRESVSQQEEEWLKKQAEMRQISESLDKDLSEEERNPVWLRDKGNAFFKAGDTHAAINAYSQAIRLNSTMPALYSNRAACHMKLGNYMKCIEDSSKALDYLTPPVPQNKESRCRAYIRRGTAFCHLELYVEGLHEYEAALKLDPSNDSLKLDAECIRKIVQGTV